jgi:hypothetical protein
VIPTTPATSTVQPIQSAQPVQENVTETTRFKAGVGAGAAALGVLLLILGYCLWARKSGKKRLWPTKKSDVDAIPQPKPPPLDTPYVPQRIASPVTAKSVTSAGSRYELRPLAARLEHDVYQSEM